MIVFVPSRAPSTSLSAHLSGEIADGIRMPSARRCVFHFSDEDEF